VRRATSSTSNVHHQSQKLPTNPRTGVPKGSNAQSLGGTEYLSSCSTTEAIGDALLPLPADPDNTRKSAIVELAIARIPACNVDIGRKQKTSLLPTRRNLSPRRKVRQRLGCPRGLRQTLYSLGWPKTAYAATLEYLKSTHLEINRAI
jgi:hypothetical protein